MWNEPGTILSRRHLLTRASSGFGMVALSGLLARGALGNQPGTGGANSLAARPTDFPSTAKSVIHVLAVRLVKQKPNVR